MGTVNYFTTVPFFALIAASGAAMIRWPEWMKRHMPQPRRRRHFQWIEGPGPDSPAWVVRLGGAVIVAVAVGFIWLAVYEARTDPNCSAGASSQVRQPPPS